MTNWAYIFPGQGAQAVGMGRELAEANTAAMSVWIDSELALALPMREIAWGGSAEQIGRTDVTQPALLTAEIAVLRVLEAEGLEPCATAGHSLGEYAALVAAESLHFTDAVRIVRARGEAMQLAAESAGGGMAAVIGGEEDVVAALCDRIGGVAPANINAPGQVVVSGTDEGLAELVVRAREIGIRRVVRLTVAGPFHSPAMAPAARAVSQALAESNLIEPSVPVYTNVSATRQTVAADLARMLVEQVTGRVLWSATIRNMVADGIRNFVELGPGNVLAGLVRRIDPDVTVYSVGDVGSLEAFLEVANG